MEVEVDSRDPVPLAHLVSRPVNMGHPSPDHFPTPLPMLCSKEGVWLTFISDISDK